MFAERDQGEEKRSLTKTGGFSLKKYINHRTMMVIDVNILE